jgi:putative phosphoesterase
MFKIGVISDTHNFLDAGIHDLFEGVEHILHAGDIGSPNIISELESMAPVTRVSGNTDDPGFNYPETEVVTLGGRKILLHHIVNPRNLSQQVQSSIARNQPDIVIFGHTHQPFSATINGVLFFNPGYAGKSRFGMERSVALLKLDEKGIHSEYLKLD